MRPRASPRTPSNYKFRQQLFFPSAIRSATLTSVGKALSRNSPFCCRSCVHMCRISKCLILPVSCGRSSSTTAVALAESPRNPPRPGSDTFAIHPRLQAWNSASALDSSCKLLLLACSCRSLFASRLGPGRSTAMSTAVACGATEVCDAVLLSTRARHACVCVPVPFQHLGQPIEAPNFLTIPSVMYTMRPLADVGPVIVWLRCFRRWQFRFSCSCSSRRRRWCMISKHCNSAQGIRRRGATNWPHVSRASSNLENHFAPPLADFWLATHGSESPRSTRPIFPSNTTSTKLVQLAELLRGGDPRPDDLSELHNCSSVLACGPVLSESRDEPRRMPNHPADEVMTQRHFAADPRFESRFERAWPLFIRSTAPID